jgi:hypothetical protein
MAKVRSSFGLVWKWLGHISVITWLWGFGVSAVVGVVARAFTDLSAVWIVVLGLGVFCLVIAGLRTWPPSVQPVGGTEFQSEHTVGRLVRSPHYPAELQEATIEEMSLPLIENRLVPIYLVPRSDYDSTIYGKSFRNCVIKGPAVLVPAGPVSWEECSYGIYESDPESIIFRRGTGPVTGIIALKFCDFYRCQTEGIGLVMSAEYAVEFIELIKQQPNYES